MLLSRARRTSSDAATQIRDHRPSRSAPQIARRRVTDRAAHGVGSRRTRGLRIEPLEERRVLAATISWVSSPPTVREPDLDEFDEPQETIISFTFQLTGELEEWSYVDWETIPDGEPGTADMHTDIQNDNWQVWFAPGTYWDPVTVNITVFGDLIPELDETFRLQVSSGDSINITNSSGIFQTGTIKDNDNW
jgi:hypothetical protein